MEIIEKITSYNIFTNLLPGAVFAYAADRYYQTDFISEDILVNVFIFYFLGVVIGRVGSLVVEPVMRATTLKRQNRYEDFLAAEKRDPKIQQLLEARNMYRSFIGLFLLLLLVAAYTYAEELVPWIRDWRGIIVGVLFGGLFSIAFIKQDRFIQRRVSAGVRDE
jgi:MFS family permease